LFSSRWLNKNYSYHRGSEQAEQGTSGAGDLFLEPAPKVPTITSIAFPPILIGEVCKEVTTMNKVNHEIKRLLDSNIDYIAGTLKEDKIKIDYAPTEENPSDVNISIVRSVSGKEVHLEYGLMDNDITLGIDDIVDWSFVYEKPSIINYDITKLLAELASNNLKVRTYKIGWFSIAKKVVSNDQQLCKDLSGNMKLYRWLSHRDEQI
jgi:hypothetical protein